MIARKSDWMNHHPEMVMTHFTIDDSTSLMNKIFEPGILSGTSRRENYEKPKK